MGLMTSLTAFHVSCDLLGQRADLYSPETFGKRSGVISLTCQLVIEESLERRAARPSCKNTLAIAAVKQEATNLKRLMSRLNQAQL